jgi:hypothetical protein
LTGYRLGHFSMSNLLRKRLLSSCYQFLVPVARFLLNASITYREFEEIARTAFVHVATEDYGLRGRETNSSRVSVMTGIGRREVAKIRFASSASTIDPRKVLSPLADVVHTWTSDPSFVDSNGAPIGLMISGTDPSFEQLVRLSTVDLPAGAVRKELERLGAMRSEPDGTLRLLRSNLIPSRADQKLVSAMSYSLRALAETVAFNSDPKNPPDVVRIERYIESRDMSLAEVSEVRHAIETRLSALTQEFNLLLSAGDSSGDGSKYRVGVGFYYSE